MGAGEPILVPGVVASRFLRVVTNRRQIVASLCRRAHASGDRIPDAWLAALALEHRATLVTADRGFARYPGLPWRDRADD